MPDAVGGRARADAWRRRVTILGENLASRRTLRSARDQRDGCGQPDRDVGAAARHVHGETLQSSLPNVGRVRHSRARNVCHSHGENAPEHLQACHEPCTQIETSVSSRGLNLTVGDSILVRPAGAGTGSAVVATVGAFLPPLPGFGGRIRLTCAVQPAEGGSAASSRGCVCLRCNIARSKCKWVASGGCGFGKETLWNGGLISDARAYRVITAGDDAEVRLERGEGERLRIRS